MADGCLSRKGFDTDSSIHSTCDTGLVPTNHDDRQSRPPSLLYVAKQLELVSRARLDEVLRPSGVTTLQYTAMTVLERRPHLTQTDLARMSFTRVQSASDLVAGLIRRGLVDRTPDPKNRRRQLLDLTPKGRELLREFDSRVAELETVMLQDFTDEEAQLMRTFMRRARHALERRPR